MWNWPGIEGKEAGTALLASLYGTGENAVCN